MPNGRSDLVVTIDGRECTAHAGESVLDVARREQIPIPTLCHLDGLSIWASCRICVVEIAGTRQLKPACATPVEDDMEVWTQNERLVRYRRMIVELFLAEGNHFCAVCVSNGACELQDLAAALGVDHVRYEYRNPDRAVDASHPKYVYDPNRCVMCTRCVRTCDEIEGAHVWDVAQRGNDVMLVTGIGGSWGDSTACTWCGKCVTACPTGALLFKGRSVAEMEHDRDLVSFLATARNERRWIDREET